MKKLMILITFLMIASASIIAKDIVVTKDGNIIRGKVLKHSDDEVKIQIDADNVLTFPKEEIKSVEFDKDDFKIENKEDIINKGFGSFGLTYGLPAGLNFTGGYHVRNFSTRLNFGVFPFGEETLFGFQALLGYPIFASESVFFTPSIPIGYFGITGFGSGAYTGIGVDMHIHGFTVNLGVATPFEDFGFAFLNFDIGYKYAWNE